MDITVNTFVDLVLPVITGPSGGAGAITSEVTIAEEGPTALHTFAANKSVTWSMIGGDVNDLNMNASTGASSLKAPANYEVKQLYVTTVRATDIFGRYAEQEFTVRISNINETTAPLAFTSSQWQLNSRTSTNANELSLVISALPNDGASTITALQYRVNGGTVVTLSSTITGTFVITVPSNAAANVEIRAVNTVGAGGWSDTKTATPQYTPAAGNAPTLANPRAFE